MKEIFFVEFYSFHHSAHFPCEKLPEKREWNSGFTDKHTKVVTEKSKRMRHASTSDVNHVSRKPLQCINITTPRASQVVESRSESIAIAMFCSLIQHGFLPVFSTVGKIMAHFNDSRRQLNIA